MLTRIGELPIDSDGNDLQLNAIRFSYVGNSKNYNCNKSHSFDKTIDIGLGTPVFDTYCNANNTKAPKLVMLEDDPSHHRGDDNKCFPNDYWHADALDWEDEF